jgi:hypothetical protein
MAERPRACVCSASIAADPDPLLERCTLEQPGCTFLDTSSQPVQERPFVGDQDRRQPRRAPRMKRRIAAVVAPTGHRFRRRPPRGRPACSFDAMARSRTRCAPTGAASVGDHLVGDLGAASMERDQSGSRPPAWGLSALHLAVPCRALDRRSQRSGKGMNSVSPGTGSKRPSAQSRLACSMRSVELDTKFHQMCRSPSMASPPRSINRQPPRV